MEIIKNIGNQELLNNKCLKSYKTLIIIKNLKFLENITKNDLKN